jgi:hypothetical protein
LSFAFDFRSLKLLLAGAAELADTVHAQGGAETASTAASAREEASVYGPNERNKTRHDHKRVGNVLGKTTDDATDWLSRSVARRNGVYHAQHL